MKWKSVLLNESYTTTNHWSYGHNFNWSPPGQNRWHFADDVFKFIFPNEKFGILINISLKFVPKGPINNNLALV